MPSVQTVSADFLDQDVQTVTQAERRRREEEEAAAAKKKARAKRAKTGDDGREGESWFAKQLARVPAVADGYLSYECDGLMALNVAGVVGVASVLGYKAWGLWERNELSWRSVGAGVGVLATVGAVEAVLAPRVHKRKEK
ncbi:hypothetical protein ESCO_002085 [Escovopsis weberi]|uniref:Mitochondrial outer membrane protein OM14 C-terminal domain-containing protein n=1 Tax=Escovopsis weberi TaxID=150374 RepID=A0A0N0RU48_ESCWE|nr:hypothetical protein ESCO_002085 [Escovopsis weberi]